MLSQEENMAVEFKREDTVTKPRAAYIAELRRKQAEQGDLLSKDKGGLFEKTNLLVTNAGDYGISELNAIRLKTLAEKLIPRLEWGLDSKREAQAVTSHLRKIIRTYDTEISIWKETETFLGEDYNLLLQERKYWSGAQTKYRRLKGYALR